MQAPITKLPGGPVDVPVAAAAATHRKTAAQILLRWSIQTGRLPLTTTSKPFRLAEYLGAIDPGFALSDAEVAAISAAGETAPRRLFWLQCDGVFCEDPRLEVEEGRL
jgi:diketogulonate reductase-like aldo/keto reductase